MGDHDILPSMVSELAAARYFEEAAAAALRAMLSAAAEALAASPRPGRGRVLRGVIHLRPGDSYRRLWATEPEPGPGAPGADAASLHSATAWRWVCERGRPLSIDLVLGMVRPWDASGKAASGDEGAALAFSSAETRQRLLRRDTTHLHVLPLRAPGGSIDGMVSIEVRCPPPAVEAFSSPACCERLSLLANVAAPYLTALPLRPVTAPKPDDLLPVVGASTAALIELLRVFAQQEETLLIAGPTGAGKSRLARWCHEQSRRKGKPFEVLDLLSVPEDLQMAELFGWKRGAFTGAIKDSPGSLARAEGGTLFLDEIDKLSLKAQAGLLRVLEERAYRPVGESAGTHRADVRFIVGTNADLREAVRAGRFREDLYYRINVLPIKVPPLAERRDELPRWASYMLARRHQDAGRDGEARFTGDALTLLLDFPWPGNLRQLDNIVRRAYALALSDATGASRDLLIQACHVERALAYEGGDNPALLEHLQRAAVAFVREAERRAGAGLSLDLADAFRGLVLGMAVQKLGDRDAALELLGLGGFVKSRNQHKILRRELDRISDLLRALGKDANGTLSEIVKLDFPPGTQ
jgi:DNA-binding NtrC family response regulator